MTDDEMDGKGPKPREVPLAAARDRASAEKTTGQGTGARIAAAGSAGVNIGLRSVAGDAKPPSASEVPAAAPDGSAAREELGRLKQEHRDLDAAIEALSRVTAGDLLQMQRLKKRKLLLKDRIAHLEDQLTPDIIA
jgi:hypothetical protein